MNRDGRTAVVTGAAGAIGSAICRRLVVDGVRVFAVDLSEERLQTLCGGDDRLTPVVADVASPAGADAIVAAAGEVDLLVNNAGRSDGGGAVDELTDELFMSVVSVNLTGAFLLARRVAPGMIARNGGVIINMSSVAGLRGGRTGAAYTASKWALIGLTQNIAATLGADGIRAHAICPGLISDSVTLGDVAPTPRALRNRTRDTGRPGPGSPEDVAAAVIFLASDVAAYLNGVSLPVDAGWLAY